MSDFETAVQIRVDITNPAHFFACCGVLELASRLTPTTEGWFDSAVFRLRNGPTLPSIIRALTSSEFSMVEPTDATASPIFLPSPLNLRLDWWKAGDRASSDLKVWAGTMECFRIAKAMQSTMKKPEFSTENLLNVGMIAYEANDPTKKVEPFYFDARRGPNAHSRDVGFAPNDLGMSTIASPAAELLCLIGLQRVRPVPAGGGKPRQFDYRTWSLPMPALLAPVAAAGFIADPQSKTYRFESWYRTGQRKHKAFLSAKLQPNTP